MDRPSQSVRLSPDPIHRTVVVFLWAGLLLGAYRGMVALGVLSPAAWVSWSHVHFVTVGGFVLLLFGMLPRYLAWKLDGPSPSPFVAWITTVVVVAAFLAVWVGRVTGSVVTYDVGLIGLWTATAGLLGWLVHAVRQSDPEVRDGSVWLVLVATTSFLWGLTIAWGLYGQTLPAPGGWLGLREAHIHANAWGFVGLSVVAVSFDGYPKLVGMADHLSGRRTATGLLALGIGPLIAGPWLGLAGTVTALGLLLYAAGFAVYLNGLVGAYRAGNRSGLGLWVLLAHGWIAAPVAFAPIVIYGGLRVSPVLLEQAALHFFFLGWLLPVALVGLLAGARQSPAWATRRRSRSDIGRAVSRRFALVWHSGVLLLGLGLLATGIIARFGIAIGTVVVVAGWGLLLLRMDTMNGRSTPSTDDLSE